MVNHEHQFQRIIEESVPGKQVTLAHVIAAPVAALYTSMEISPAGAIGILTLSPCETAMIAADYAMKMANVEIGFMDRHTGSVVISGSVDSVETALREVNRMLRETLGFLVPTVTKT